ncbi:MAG: hypothetical protein OXI57_04605 [Rhodospirillales bacterium]|nr:hypothetical protein [Rhodospirillales bacterium]
MADRARIGVITGLASEAATLPDDDFWIAVSAANSARASEAAETMIAGGVSMLVSYGFAAGIDPRLGPGALLLPETVIAHEGEVKTPDRGGVRDQLQRITSFKPREGQGPPEPPPDEAYVAVDTAMREVLSQELGMRIAGGALAGVDRPLMRQEEKLALFAQTRARAADMESHVVARAATAAGVPFVVIRVVSDPSNRTLPRAAVAGINEDGRIDGRAVAVALLRSPWECTDMVTLALDGAQAMHRLRRVGRRAAPLLLSL